MKTNSFYVITGGPGAGKTTLLQALAARGYETVEEDARCIIREQVRSGGDALPWKNRERYTRLMLQASVAAYENALARKGEGACFFDRGIPDALCYAAMCGIRLPETIRRLPENFRYNTRVFMLPPWPGIYHTDAERRQDLAEAEQIFAMMRETYQAYAYEPVPVPEGTPDARADFVLKYIAGLPG